MKPFTRFIARFWAVREGGDAVFRWLRNGRATRLFAAGRVFASDLGFGSGYSVETLGLAILEAVERYGRCVLLG